MMPRWTDSFSTPLRVLAFLALWSGFAHGALDIMPAARVHVRHVDGVPMRFTSKLAQVVELNFTLGFDHMSGKQGISQVLSRIAADYALSPEPAFALRKFVGPGNGAGQGLPAPLFTLEELQAADVIVTNNVSNLNTLPSKSLAAATALETAVRGGKSVINFHASADGWNGWKFYSEDLIPLQYIKKGSQMSVPVYRNDTEERHIVLQNVLASGTAPRQVLMGLDSAGLTILKQDVPIRMVKGELFMFAMNPLADLRYAPLSTCLLRYDPSVVSNSDHPTSYKFPGGNAYSCIFKAGEGKSAYIPSGHDYSEVLSETGLDGGTGDFERYFAQMLFYLAGYESEPCGGAVECQGLPLVDSQDRLTGGVFGSVSVLSRPKGLSLRAVPVLSHQARLRDIRGRLLATGKARAVGNREIEGAEKNPRGETP